MSTKSTTINELEKNFHEDLRKRKNQLQKELGEITEQLNSIESKKDEFFKERIHVKDPEFGPILKKLIEISKEVDQPIEVDVDGIKFVVWYSISLQAKLSLGWDAGEKLSKNNPKILLDFFEIDRSKRNEFKHVMLPIIKEQTKDRIDVLNNMLTGWKEEYKAVVKNMKLASYMEKELMDDIIIAVEKYKP